MVGISKGFLAIFRGRRMDQDLNEQIQSHLEMLADEHIAAGMRPAEAWKAARREFGGLEQVREAHRDQRGFVFLNSIRGDLRYAWRMFVRSPGFAAVSVLTLALGIGANTAIFTLMNTLMLRSLPVQDPGQLVEFLNKYPGEPGGNGFSWQSYENFRDHNHVFSGLFGDTGPSRLEVRAQGSGTDMLDADYITGSFFADLGLRAARGRLISSEDDRIGAGSAVAVVSWSCWKSRFGLDPAISRKTNGTSAVVTCPSPLPGK